MEIGRPNLGTVTLSLAPKIRPRNLPPDLRLPEGHFSRGAPLTRVLLFYAFPSRRPCRVCTDNGLLRVQRPSSVAFHHSAFRFVPLRRRRCVSTVLRTSRNQVFSKALFFSFFFFFYQPSIFYSYDCVRFFFFYSFEFGLTRHLPGSCFRPTDVRRRSTRFKNRFTRFSSGAQRSSDDEKSLGFPRILFRVTS